MHILDSTFIKAPYLTFPNGQETSRQTIQIVSSPNLDIWTSIVSYS